jgi:predicted RNase H-like HicB family nuclease
MVEMTDTYTAVYELDTNKWWFVHIDEIPGCHSRGGNIAAARRNILEAASALLEVDESELVIEDDVQLPEPLRKAVAVARQRRAEAEQVRGAAQEATDEALRTLNGSGLGLSTRDMGDLLGVSHQRVNQVLSGKANGDRSAAS